MRTTIEWLDAAKARLDIQSDYAAAKALGVTRSTISGYRTGRTVFDEKICIRVAEILGVDPLEVIASARVESAKDAETRGVWMHALEIFSKGFRLLALPANACGAWLPQV
ncbi:helix-turn-helix domain-containing protein [Paraburkholderia sp. SIMBA_009]|uniref:helix-turn-helix domain-containing protein n=1 Tax=Paraburkholderia TaxID=1822464 RepID=UPI001620A390|nr:helix-turn-helix domain-containing protein [Paraburkholderia tropica]MBB6324358.1 transcriptional regulator with XRE-family HTH domain [Paraburkholderia tropica]MDE1139781.1 helix-turn-helix domain-containing protein [Paraburkholderia tropica]